MTLPAATTPEFSRPVDPRRLDAKPYHLEASEAERGALARRFGLVALEELTAALELDADGDAVVAKGRMFARFTQSCAVSGDDLPMNVEEELHIRFVPARSFDPDEEVELEAEDCDEVEYEGATFDLGEAVAQSLALAIDPYATGPNAEKARREAGLLDEAAAGPFAALAALKKKD